MAKEFLEDTLKQVTVREIEGVHLPSARAKFAEISRGTRHPTLPDQTGSSNPKMLSTSVKFDKSKKSNDPLIGRVVQRGMYLTPAGQHGCADTCKDKTAGCSAACLNVSGRLGLQQANQMARTHMLKTYPAEALALIADEAHTFFEDTIKQGNIPSLRLDGTSELHIDQMDAGDYIFQGPGGKYAATRKGSEFGPTQGFPMAVGSEYGKRHAKGVLPGNEPEMRQPNVRRVASWNERTTKERAEQLTSRGRDIAVPVTNLGTSSRPIETPSHISVQFGGGGSLILPATDYDEHDVVGLREQTGSAGVLRQKLPGFGLKFDPSKSEQIGRFLREHPAVEAPVSAPKRRRR